MHSEMKVNGRSIDKYNARLLNFNVSGTERSYSSGSARPVLLLPDMYQTALSPRRLSVTLTFYPRTLGESSRGRSIPEKLHRSTENIVKFESDISNRVLEIILPDGYIYKSFLQSAQTPSFDATGEQDVEYIFLAIRQKSPIKETIAAGGVINCISNTDTLCRISFTVPVTIPSMTICGIRILDIAADTEIVIDGEKGIITANGINKFADTDLIDFPYLVPGINVVSCTAGGLSITVEYTPIYA